MVDGDSTGGESRSNTYAEEGIPVDIILVFLCEKTERRLARVLDDVIGAARIEDMVHDGLVVAVLLEGVIEFHRNGRARLTLPMTRVAAVRPRAPLLASRDARGRVLGIFKVCRRT